MDSSSTLNIILQLKDEASAALANFASTSAASFQQIGEQAKAVGEPLAAVGAAMTAISGYAVAQAADVQEAGTQLEQTFNNQIKNANDSTNAHSALATEIQFVSDKMTNLEAENDKLAATHETSAAGAAKVAAQINVNNDAITKYKDQLSGLQGQLTLTGASSDALVKQFEAVAAANTNLGFSQADSITSLTTLERVIGNPTEALQAYQTALDLARARGEDLNTSTTQVIQGFNGMGKSLQLIGVNVKDGLAGMQAIGAISDQVGGSAAAAMGDFNTQMDVLHAKLQMAAGDLGETLLPILTSFLEKVDTIVEKISAWSEAHPALSKAIFTVVAALGALLLVVGTALTVFGFLAGSVAAIATAFGVAAGVVLTTVGIIVGVIVAAAVIVALIIAYHTQIAAAITTAWNAIVSFLQGVWNGIKSFFSSIWQGILDVFNSIAAAIGTAIKYFADFWVGLIITALNLLFPQWQTFFTNLYNILKKIWDEISSYTSQIFGDISTIINTALTAISSVWNDTWQTISGFFSSIWDGIKNTINSAIQYIDNLIDALVSKVNSVVSTVMGPINSIGSALASAGKAVGGAVSSIVSTGANALTKLATGGIVNSPTIALVGEDGPEAVIPLSMMGKGSVTPLGSGVGSGGGVVININGGTYLDQNVAIQIANSVAKVVGQQMKLRTT